MIDSPPIPPGGHPAPQPGGDRPRATFDEPTLRRFLSHIVDPSAGATELRILGAQYESADVIAPNPKYQSILSAWYDNANAIVNDARKLRNVSAYICLNPTTPDLLGRSYNRLTKVRNATTDDDIVCLRWFYIDVDPVRPADISATHEELAAAVAKRDAILDDHPEIRRVSLTGRSGNGAFIMARLPDYPNDHDHRSLVAAALDSIIARYSDARIKIDVKTKNPSRVGCVPGTLKCKGSHIPARPWKMATLEGEPERPGDGPDGQPGSPPTLDLRDWLARNPAPVAVAPARPVAQRPASAPWVAGTDSRRDDHSHRVYRATRYVAAKPPSICGNQECHDKAFGVACDLIKGFDLGEGDARPILLSWMAGNPSHQWKDQEISHKLRSADQLPDDRPRGYLFDAQREGWDDAPRTPYAGPGADFIIPQVIAATGGNGAAHVAVAHAVANGYPATNGHPSTGGNGHAIVNGHAPATPGEPAILVEPIKARAAHHVANSRVEDLYRDVDFLASFGRLERANPGEAAAIKSGLRGIKGFLARDFKASVEGTRSARRRPVAGADHPGDAARPDEPPPFRPTDMGNADLLLAAHGHEMRYVKAYGDWVVNDGKRWNEDKRNVAGQWAQEVPGMIGEQITPEMDDDETEAVRAWQLKSESKERLSAVLSVAMARVTTTPETFDRDPWLFNCQNGTIDLRTGEFRPHNPGDFLTKLSPVIFDHEARCPLWEAFILRIMKGDRETADYVRRIMGYAMTGNVKDHAFFICYGVGANGKSSMLSTISHVLGDYSTQLDPEIILAQANAMHPTGLTDLEGRRFVVCEETDDRRGLAESLLKRITSGEMIRARKIGQNYYDFPPTHHTFLATNNLPDVKGSDDGIWRRLKLIPFQMKFDGKSGDKPDPDMPAKLQAEAAGILNWMLVGLEDWKANGLFDCPVVKDATRDFREDSDLLGWFLNEMTVDVRDVPNAMVVFKVAYGEYKNWAEQNNIKHPIGPKKFGAELNDRGFVTHKAGGLTYKRGLNLKINGKVMETVVYNPPDAGGREPGDDGE